MSGRQTGTRIRAPLPSKTGPSIEKSGWKEDQREGNEIQTDMDREEQRLLSVPRGHSDTYPVGLLRSCLPHPEFPGLQMANKNNLGQFGEGLVSCDKPPKTKPNQEGGKRQPRDLREGLAGCPAHPTCLSP